VLAGFLLPMQTRESSAKRGYGSRWQKARADYLRKHPLCSQHEGLGQIVGAVVVDHITPHKGDKSLFWDSSNWQPLCKHCHDSYKQRLEKSGTIIGCDTNGMPIDSHHHWHRVGG